MARARRWPAVTVTGALTAELIVAAAACGADGAGEDATLRVVGSADVDHLDTASGYSTLSSGLTRQFARSLFNIKASHDFNEAIKIRPDVAAELPTTSNGGLSRDGKTYTIKLRNGVRWNTAPPREVTAADFVRGIKRLCNPASPSGAIGYYTATIAGLDTFCQGFGKVNARSAGAIADYQNRHQVSGLHARDGKTLVVRLTRPANDFTNILGLQFAAAAPAEYDRYLPDGPQFRRHTISNGPYQITFYTPNTVYTLAKNPAWRQDTDPLRTQHLDQIQITLGQDSPEAVHQQIEQGTADLSWDQPVPTAKIPSLRSNPNFKIMDGSTNNPYLVFNTLSPNNRGALGKTAVRRAIAYAIDKRAVVQIYGGPEVAEPLNQVIPPRSVGHQPLDPYPTPDNRGDPGRCRRILAAAGYPAGLRLRFPYRTNSNHPKIAQSVQANLKACGITADLAPDTNGNLFGRTLVTPADAKAGAWDIATPGWVPDWYGNNGRSTIVPLFDGRTYGPNSTNYGGYNNPQVNQLIDQALQAKTTDAAAGFWALADRLIMNDAAIVPMINQRHPTFHSSRVRNPQYLPTMEGFDLNQISLST